MCLTTVCLNSLNWIRPLDRHISVQLSHMLWLVLFSLSKGLLGKAHPITRWYGNMTIILNGAYYSLAYHLIGKKKYKYYSNNNQS